VDFTPQVGMLEQATDTVLAMVRQLRRIQEMEKIKELNERLQYIEGEADKLMLDLLRDLYSGRHDPLKVIVLRTSTSCWKELSTAAATRATSSITSC
jgi:hypothetical protein